MIEDKFFRTTKELCDTVIATAVTKFSQEDAFALMLSVSSYLAAHVVSFHPQSDKKRILEELNEVIKLQADSLYEERKSKTN